MDPTAEMWICGVCRSVNKRGIDRCYKCHSPREIAATSADDLDKVKPAEILAPKGTFQPGETYAVMATIAAVVFVLATLGGLVFLFLATDAVVSGDLDRAESLFRGPWRLLIFAGGAAGIATLVSYALWMRRAIENLPALGLGYSRVGPTWAFIEPLIPGVNLAVIPARLSEVAGKLDIGASTSPLLGLAALLVIGPAAVAAVLYRFTRYFGTGDEFLRLASLAGVVIFVLQAVALALVLIVVWRLERRFKERSASVPAGSPAHEAQAQG